MHANESRRHHANANSKRLSAWPKAFVGIGIAALAFAIHRHKHAPHRSPPPDGGEPIITPPPPREV